MKICKHWTYTKKIRWRIRALWALLAGMLVYMFVIGELGGGDSRTLSANRHAWNRSFPLPWKGNNFRGLLDR